MFLPVDRRDLLEILDLQDSIADTAQDIAGMMFVRHMTLPEDMHRSEERRVGKEWRSRWSP